VADLEGDGVPDTVVVMGYDTHGGVSEFGEGRTGQDPADPLARVFSSTEPQDLLQWPEEFRNEDGEPVVFSAQDFVTIYNDISGEPQMEAGRCGIEVKQRSMAFLGGFNFNAILVLFEITNRSDSLPDGPFTLEDAYVGFASDMDIGGDYGDDVSSVLDSLEVYGRGTIPLNAAVTWDSDFTENDWTGKVGFVGTCFFQPPGNPWDGIDNDGDGIVDENPRDGIDDDGDGVPDDLPDEVDALDGFHFTVMRGVFEQPPFEPLSDREAYRKMSCPAGRDCGENTIPEDVRCLISSGSFDLHPGETQVVGVAVFMANPAGSPEHLGLSGDPPRPDPGDPALSEFTATIIGTRALYESGFDDRASLRIYASTDLDDTNDHSGPYIVSTTIVDSVPLARSTIKYRVDGGPVEESLLVNESGDTFTGEIPGQPFWSSVTYYLQAVDSAYCVVRDPPDAPLSAYEFSVVDVPGLEPVACGVCTSAVAAAPADYDLDGLMDVFLTTTGGTVLYRNTGDFTFEDVTGGSGIETPEYSTGASWGDYDNDGFPDLFISARTGSGGTHLLYRNLGDGTFEDVTAAAHLTDSLSTAAGLWGDVNGDGFLDLFTAQIWTDRLYLNLGDGTFEDRTAAWGIEETRTDYAASFLDMDGDRDLDLVIVGAGVSTVYENIGGERFEDVTGSSGIGNTLWDGISIGDYDSDGDADLLFSGNRLTLYENGSGTGVFTDVTEVLGLSGAPEDASWVDLNADGLLDIVTTRPAILIRKPEGAFVDLSETAGLSDDDWFQFIILPFDADADGLEDIAGVSFYRNDGYPGGFSRNWLELRLEGTLSNRSSVGARARITAGQLSSTRWMGEGGGRTPDSPVLHFGLDTRTVVDSLVVDWPSGIRQILEDLEPNRLYLVVEDSTQSGVGHTGREAGLPAAFSLFQNYPNPFNPRTTISFEVPGGAGRRQARLTVYDIRGRRVKTLVDSPRLEAGTHRIVWDGRSSSGEPVSSGVYLYILKCGETSFTRKLVLLR
jgi:hypothetical protein